MGRVKTSRGKVRGYSADDCVGRLRTVCALDGQGLATNRERAQSTRVMLATLTVAQLVEVCDTLHVGDGRSYAQLRRMSKAKLVALIVGECTPRDRAIERTEV